MNDASLQDHYAPEAICFGCGPANDKGLRIKSFLQGDETVLDWMPRDEHRAYPGIVNGGIVGALFDCHMNWTAAHHIMKGLGRDEIPCTVTADFHVKLKRPTPSDRSIHVVARVVESEEKRATIEAEMTSDGVLTATCRARFVAVDPGHPAYSPTR